MDNARVGRNNPCSCGSGKKYKKCCLGKAKAVAFNNYLGQKAEYPLEEANLSFNKFKQLLLDVPGKQSVSLKKGLEVLLDLYELYEDVQKYFYPFYSCKKGCSYCCYPYVGVSLLEGELARKYIRDNISKENQDLFLKKILQHKDDFLTLKEVKTPGSLTEYLNKQIACPFLSIAGNCLIYPVRPLACRGLAVISDPEECKLDRSKEHFIPFGINDYAINAVLKLSKKVFGESTTVKHFPACFIDGFDIIEFE